MTDLGKLPPAPWRVGRSWGRPDLWAVLSGENLVLHGGSKNTCEGVALTRNALDVMLRRRCETKRYADGTYDVQDERGDFPKGLLGWVQSVVGRRPFTDPFSPLVDADRWLTEHEGGLT